MPRTVTGGQTPGGGTDSRMTKGAPPWRWGALLVRASVSPVVGGPGLAGKDPCPAGEATVAPQPQMSRAGEKTTAMRKTSPPMMLKLWLVPRGT